MEKEDKKQKKADSFYDSKFSIEAIQKEPYEDGFTWKTILGALFIAFVMLPGLIFMGLMIGQDMGTAAEWVTIILFVEIARRALIQLKKQELYILKYTATQLTHISGGLALGGGIFAHLVWNRYMKTSEAFKSFGIAHELPNWVAPFGDAVYNAFFSVDWLPVIVVITLSMLLSKVTQLSLGFLIFKITADVEKLPFPMAPIHAEGAIALAETSQDKNTRGYRQYCFSLGAIIGAGFGLFYVAIPILTGAFLKNPIQLIPIPFLDLTRTFENIIPSGTVGIDLNLALMFIGFVLPWKIVIGGFIGTVLFQIILNPIFYHLGWITSWSPGKDAIETHLATTLDIYLSVGIGTAFAVFFVGVYGIIKAVLRYGKDKKEKASKDEPVEGLDIAAFWRRDKERGDPPTWLLLGVWVLSAISYIILSDHLINSGVVAEEQFSIWWLVGFAFGFTPLNSYINARMSGIAGQHAGIPFVTEGAIFASGYKGVSIWFAPIPNQNYGVMADLLKEVQLTRTKFTSIYKVELFVFPLLLLASFIFWSYVTGLGPIPSSDYPYVQKFWPYHAQMKALWASSLQEGDSLLLEAIKPGIIFLSLGLGVLFFGGFSLLGLSHQYIYGAIAALNAYPHKYFFILLGAVLGRFVLSKIFGKEAWQNYTPILTVGFAAGVGLIGMFAIAINFLWTSINTGF